MLIEVTPVSRAHQYSNNEQVFFLLIDQEINDKSINTPIYE